jgi:hypothetical protein
MLMQVVVKGSAISDNLEEEIHRKSNAFKGVCSTKDVRKTDCSVYSEASPQFDKEHPMMLKILSVKPSLIPGGSIILNFNHLKSVFYDSLIWLFIGIG